RRWLPARSVRSPVKLETPKVTVQEMNTDSFRHYALRISLAEFRDPRPGRKARNVMRAILGVVLNLVLGFASIGVCLAVDVPEPASSAVGHAHMDTSCSPAMSLKFDEGIALLHNFWYPRALSTLIKSFRRTPDVRSRTGVPQ